MKNSRAIPILLFSAALLAGCANSTVTPNSDTTKTGQPTNAEADTPKTVDSNPQTQSPTPTKPELDQPQIDKPQANQQANAGHASQVAATPSDVAVMVNKQIQLPDGYTPTDLVEPNVPFIFQEKAERRFLRKEAAQALEKLFAAAKNDGIQLAGVSGYRSYETQKSLFNYYVSIQGEEQAKKYSAVPGHSEHQTGLAMDVSGITGKCAAEDCFADTPEAKWLAEHADEYGFIIRYPKGKEAVTGYNYEPWHIRYVGVGIAQEIYAKGITLEEYYSNHAVAVK